LVNKTTNCQKTAAGVRLTYYLERYFSKILYVNACNLGQIGKVIFFYKNVGRLITYKTFAKYLIENKIVVFKIPINELIQ